MNRVFADAVYWVALAHSRDQWHPRSVEVSRTLGGVQLVTTEEVLSEFLAHFSGYGTVLRQAAVRFVESITNDKAVVVRSHIVTAGEANPGTKRAIHPSSSFVSTQVEEQGRGPALALFPPAPAPDGKGRLATGTFLQAAIGWREPQHRRLGPMRLVSEIVSDGKSRPSSPHLTSCYQELVMGTRLPRGRNAQTTTTPAGQGLESGPSLRFSMLGSLLVIPLVLLALALGSRSRRREAHEERGTVYGSSRDIHINTQNGQIVVELFATTGPEARKRNTDDIAISTFFSVICQAGFYDESRNYFDQGEKGLHLCGGPDKQLGEDRLIRMFGRDKARQGSSSYDPRKRGDFGLLVEDRFEGYSVCEPGFHSGRFMIVLSDDLDSKDTATQIVELRFIQEEMNKDKVYNYRMRQYGLSQNSIMSSMYQYSDEEYQAIQKRIENLSLIPQRTNTGPSRPVPKFVRLGRVTQGLDVADKIAGQLKYYDNHGSVMISSSSRVSFELE